MLTTMSILSYPNPSNSSMVRVKSAEKNSCPPKYNSQRESVPEIPRNYIEKLLKAIDTDMDGRISLKELQEFGKKTKVLKPKEAKEMFHEITQYRALVHKEQLDLPITLEELQLFCKSYFTSHSQE